MLLAYEAILSEGGHVDAAMEVDTETKKFFGDDKVAFGGLSTVSQSLLTTEDIAVSSLKDSPMGRWDSNDLRHWLTGVLEEKDSKDMDASLRHGLHTTIIDKLVDHVNAEREQHNLDHKGKLEERGNKKRKYTDATPSFFGSTTMSHRSKKFYVGSDGAGGRSSTQAGKPAASKLPPKSNASSSVRSASAKAEAATMTSGQIFLRINLDSVVGGEALLREGITPRQADGAIAIIRSAMKTRSV